MQNKLGNKRKRGSGERMSTPTPTPNELVQIRKIWIDLSDLDLPLKTTATEILRGILKNYNARILILISFGDQFEIINDFKGIAKRISKEEENDEVMIDRIARELDEIRYLVTSQHITVIMLYTGRETAVAFVEPRE
jgi:hypothetical protein